jgi:hypothetical protein
MQIGNRGALQILDRAGKASHPFVVVRCGYGAHLIKAIIKASVIAWLHIMGEKATTSSAFFRMLHNV